MDLSKEEKLSALIYVYNEELAKDEIIKKKQLEMLRFMWESYIKGCPYECTVVKRTEKYNVVYTFD